MTLISSIVTMLLNPSNLIEVFYSFRGSQQINRVSVPGAIKQVYYLTAIQYIITSFKYYERSNMSLL